MKINVPVEKNKDYEIEITGFGYEGEGVGKVEDFTVFVPGALKGETVKVKIVKISKNFSFGKLLEVIHPSKDRVVPICPIYKRCGGCQLQHLSYEGQLKFKKDRVEDNLTRIGGLNINTIMLNETIGMESPYRYRNKVQLPIGKKDGKVLIGFYAERSHEIINMDSCLIQNEEADKAAEITKKWAEKYDIDAYNEEDNSGKLRHIMIRKAFETGEVMIVLVTNGEVMPHKQEFVNEILENIPGIKSIIQNVNMAKTNVILGTKCLTLWGEDFITDYIDKFKFHISPLSFFQVNPIQTEVLYKTALDYAKLTGEETVFDAYCGTGTISLFLSQKAKKVYGVEIIPQAIENAKHNAEDNGIKNVEFIVGQSEVAIPELIKQGVYADVVVVDPPRKGCGKDLLEAIGKMEPKRIVYVSCDPGTLARDLAILEVFGYITKEVQPVDMFPQTGHVECVVRLCRKINS
jgi:23S rRNA (uracil1939-C5)-methyltransferase